MRNWTVAALVLISAGLATTAQAKLTTQTSFNYFAVHGKTPREIYADLLAHGPQVGGVDALATTNVSFSQKPVLAPGASCRMKSFSTRLVFRVTLPRLADDTTTPASARTSWARFASELRAHEAHHKAIWIGCANRLERQVLALKSSTCESFNAAYAEISRKNLAQCGAENQAFDASERLRFLTLPFMRLVTKEK